MIEEVEMCLDQFDPREPRTISFVLGAERVGIDSTKLSAPGLGHKNVHILAGSDSANFVVPCSD